MNAKIIGLAAFAAFIFFRGDKAQAAQVSVEDQDTSAPIVQAEQNADVNIVIPEDVQMTNNIDANRKAFLYMLRSCEHVFPRDVVSGACYNIFYGGSTFNDMTDHPVLTGEKLGVPLPDAMCAASGLGPGCVSSAAGAYQLIKPTWKRVRAISPRLEDFSEASQDEAALRLLGEIGALVYIDDGNIPAAIRLASKVWASLPGSVAKQNPKQTEYALNRFNEGLTA